MDIYSNAYRFHCIGFVYINYNCIGQDITNLVTVTIVVITRLAVYIDAGITNLVRHADYVTLMVIVVTLSLNFSNTHLTCGQISSLMVRLHKVINIQILIQKC